MKWLEITIAKIIYTGLLPLGILRNLRHGEKPLPTFSEDFKPDFMSTCQVWSIIYEFCYLHTFNLWQDCKNDTFNSGSVVSLVVPILKNGGRLLKSFTLLNHITATALQQSSNWSSRRPISKTPGKHVYIQTRPSSLKNFSMFWKKPFGLWCSCPTNGYTRSEKCDWQCHFMKHTVCQKSPVV